ncbi:MAG: Flp pilus assembly complex ATPase component TadA [Planctomycetes bacterium]|nr:Flp pilus assembly complex ATPase component TadA [Planctomycetota bacterium]
MASKRIGDILVELGYLTEDRLAQVSHVANGDGMRFGERLCRLGLIQQDHVVHALAIQHEIPHLRMNGMEIPAEALACVPADLAERYRVLPLAIEDGRLRLAMADPFDVLALNDLAVVCGLEIVAVYVRPSELADAIRRHYGTSAARMADSLANGSRDLEAADDEGSVGHLHELAREPSLINLVNLIVMEAVQDGASDIHIEPFERQLKVKYRIDGVLHEMAPPSKHLQAAIVSRVKIMAQLNIAERFLPQDGHIKFSAPGAHVDIRVSTVPTVYGESVVLRLLDQSQTRRQLTDLGMSPAMLTSFQTILRKPHGNILVTGPTGSGKTTTLYAGLNQMYTPEKKIITIEDPVEFHLEGVNQIQVNVKRGLTFANGLRSILRQDPDIIMVGEIRDNETADIAIRSALTGHLVLSSLHTNDSAGAITRLLDMGIEPYLLATSVEAVVAQRLVRILCGRCVESYPISPQTLQQLGPDAPAFAGATLQRARGCQECHGVGYRGRVGIFEMIRVTEPVRELILQRPASSQIRQAAGADFVSMRQDGYRKVLAGVTTLEEVWRVTQDVEENGVA